MIALMHISGHAFAKWPAALIFAGAIAVLSGCQTAPTAKPDIAAPSLRLIDSEPLVLAEGCAANGSFFVEFTVLSNGRTDNIRTPPAPACVQQALTAWVGSFRYSPLAAEMPGSIASSIEWMLVTARRGS